MLGSNPLPASLNLDVRKLTDLSQFNAEAKAMPIVDSTTPTDYNSDVICKLNTVITVIEWVGAIIAIILLTISIVIIMNTIRTAVTTQNRDRDHEAGGSHRLVRSLAVHPGGDARGVAWRRSSPGAVVSRCVPDFIRAGGAGATSSACRSTGALYCHPADRVVLVGGVAVGAFGSFLGVRRFLSA